MIVNLNTSDGRIIAALAAIGAMSIAPEVPPEDFNPFVIVAAVDDLYRTYGRAAVAKALQQLGTEIIAARGGN